MNKNIWLFHHYADPPDGHWTNHYDLFRVMVQKGYKVTIFTSSFSHYSRKDVRLKLNEKFKEQYIGGIRFIFIKTTPYYDNGKNRYLSFLTYGYRAYRLGIKDKEVPDVIIGSSPHPLCALAAMMVANKRKTKFFFEVHDLWPQFFIEIGAFSQRHPITFLTRWIEKLLLKRAERVLPLWPRMDLYFESLGIPKNKCVWMPMGVNCDELNSENMRPDSNKTDFIVMYRGRFGATQDMETILQSAKLISVKNNNIRFVIVGEGPEREKLISYVNNNALNNVQFRGFLPKDQMQNDIAGADVLLGSLPDLPHFMRYGMISSKLLDYLSANRPVIFATGVKNHLLTLAGAGFVVPPKDSEALADTILKVASMSPEDRSCLGANGLKYIRENHDVKMLADRLASII